MKHQNIFNSKRIFLAVLLFILIYLRFAVIPVKNEISIIKESIQSRQQEKKNINETILKYNMINKLTGNLFEKNKPFPAGISIIGYIETQLNQIGLKKKIMKLSSKDVKNLYEYSSTTVFLQMSSLELSELIETLGLFDNSGYAVNYEKIEISKDIQNKFNLILEIKSLAKL